MSGLPAILPMLLRDGIRMKLGIVIPVFNQLAIARTMLQTLRTTLDPAPDTYSKYEIVLVDDLSDSATRSWIASLAGQPDLKVLINPVNLGFASACNFGATACADADVLAFLNSDLVLRPGWIAPMWRTLLHDPLCRVGVVGNIQYRVTGADETTWELDHAGVCLTPAGQFDHVRDLPHGAPPVQHTLAVTGACMLLYRKVFDEVGGFDTAYRNGCEDYDLCFKLRGRGLHVVVATESRIGHHVRASRGTRSRQDEFNSRLLFGRWRPLIKDELAAQWQCTWAAQGQAVLAPWLPGQLTSGFASGRLNAAAEALAEATLLRHEHRWAHELEGIDLNAGLHDRRSGSAFIRAELGLKWHSIRKAWSVQGEATWVVYGVRTVRDFHVCGYLAWGVDRAGLEITLCVDGVHQQTFPLHAGDRHLNVGLVSPLMLPELKESVFTARVTRVTDGPCPSMRPTLAGAVFVTHLVVDGNKYANTPSAPLERSILWQHCPESAAVTPSSTTSTNRNASAGATATTRNTPLAIAWRDLAEASRRHSLTRLLGEQDIRQRYRRSALGPFWLTISMGVLIGAIGVVFGKAFGAPMAEFLPSVSAGIIIWTFMSAVVSEGCTSFIASHSIIKQLPIPLSVHVLRTLWRNVLMFAHNMLIFPIVLLIVGKPIGLVALWSIPGFLLAAFNMTWIALLLATICTRYRDMPQMVTSLIQVMFYVTPVIWLPGAVSGFAANYILDLNPAYHLLEIVRAPLLGTMPTAANWGASIIMAIAGATTALMFFGRYQRRIPYWL